MSLGLVQVGGYLAVTGLGAAFQNPCEVKSCHGGTALRAALVLVGAARHFACGSCDSLMYV